MNKSRMEAFSDGVLAVIITVMVLEMKSPRSTTLTALRPVIPVFLTYILSFVNLAIYWNNITTCCMQHSASTAQLCGLALVASMQVGVFRPKSRNAGWVRNAS